MRNDSDSSRCVLERLPARMRSMITVAIMAMIPNGIHRMPVGKKPMITPITKLIHRAELTTAITV